MKLARWIGKGALSIIGGLIVIVAVISLVTQSPATGARAGWAILHFGLVSTGIVVSYSDNVGPSLAEGQKIGQSVTPASADALIAATRKAAADRAAAAKKAADAAKAAAKAPTAPAPPKK